MRNFAFYVEDMDAARLAAVDRVPAKERYVADGRCTPRQQRAVDAVCAHGHAVAFVNVDLVHGTGDAGCVGVEMVHRLTDVLDTHASLWESCTAFVVEKQMAFGHARNPTAVRLAHHCASYFAVRYGRFKDIVDFQASHKTRVLGAAKLPVPGRPGVYRAMGKPARKRWAVAEARRVFGMRADAATLAVLEDARKRDDLADVACQMQAFKYLVYVARSLR